MTYDEKSEVWLLAWLDERDDCMGDLLEMEPLGWHGPKRDRVRREPANMNEQWREDERR